MSWEKELEELRRREELAKKMGGEEKVKRHRDAGKLTVRERIEKLLDKESFHEVGAIAGKGKYNDSGELVDFQPANFILGRGKIDGRAVVVGGDDFTVRGGAGDAAIMQKQVMAEQMANELRLPIVRLIDGTGGGGSVKTIEVLGFTYLPHNPGWDWVVKNLGTVPVVSLGLGSVAGLGAARLVTSHYSVMVQGISQMFIAGPPVVARTGITMTKEELGGAEIHARAGAVDDIVASEEDAFAKARQFLSFLPPSVDELAERVEPTDDANRREESLLSAVPQDRRKVYDMRKILNAVADKGSLFEMSRKFGGPAITALARLDGWPVAVLASDPFFYGGAWTADAAKKAERFIDLANTFHLPIVNFVDVPGFIIGPDAEKAGTIRYGAKALAAMYQSEVPQCSIMIRKSFGVAGAGHMNHTRLHYRYAWPSGDWGSLPIEGGIEAAYRAELEASSDPKKLLGEIEDRLNRYRSPFRTAETFMVEEIIDPRNTRPLLCEFANLTAKLRKAGPFTKPMRP